ATVAGATLLGAGNNGTFYPQATLVNLDASDNSTLSGDAIAASQAVANISLMTGSLWTGAARPMDDVSIDPTSAWLVTGDSTLRGTLTNAG
ncbi:hypothetical protein SB773_31710, partial [Bacillus sp. SIMBA_074]|uniref:hypothetical protein n=1 Tax=Bacillus sp. SIMBA_074 TaxID=3085812 RepID=UPI00397CDF26